MFPSYLMSEKGANLVPGQTPSSLQIVCADAADANRLTSIAVAAKRSWGYPEAWLELRRPLLMLTSDFASSQRSGHPKRHNLEAVDVYQALIGQFQAGNDLQGQEAHGHEGVMEG